MKRWGVGRVDTRIAHPPVKTANRHYALWNIEPGRRLSLPAPMVGVNGSRAVFAAARLSLITECFADHIVERQDGGRFRSTQWSLFVCGSHHTFKTAQERAKRNAKPA